MPTFTATATIIFTQQRLSSYLYRCMINAYPCLCMYVLIYAFVYIYIYSGIVLWINRRGIMVDPPPHSGSILASNGIPANLIDTIFLTHCHADHDAGLFQKIISGKKITVTTTKTIMNR